MTDLTSEQNGKPDKDAEITKLKLRITHLETALTKISTGSDCSACSCCCHITAAEAMEAK